MTNSDITVVPATVNDIPGILAVLQHNLFSNKTTLDAIGTQGFLMHGFTAEELHDSIARNDHIILVARENNQIVGYAIEYEFQQNLPDWLSHLAIAPELMNALATQKIFYHRHIAKLANKKNIGEKLMQGILSQAQARKCHLILCKIANAPIKNARSAIFHERFGFQKIGTDAFEGTDYDLYLLRC